MWNNNGSSQDAPPRRSSATSHGNNEEGIPPRVSDYIRGVETITRQMRDGHHGLYPNSSAAYYDDPSLAVYAQQRRAHELDLMRLQALQEQEAYAEEAALHRQIELERREQHIQEYIRTEAMLEEYNRRAAAREAAAGSPSRAMLAAGVGGPYSGNQIAEFLAGHRSRAMEEDADAWRMRHSPGALAVTTSESNLKRSKCDSKPIPRESPSASSPEKKKRKLSEEDENPESVKRYERSISVDQQKTSNLDSPKMKAARAESPKKKPSSPKRAKVTESKAPLVTTNGSSSVAKSSNGEVSGLSAESDLEQTPKEPVTTTAPVEKYASKTLAHLKTIQESHTSKESNPSKASKKRKHTTAKKMDSLASIPDKPSSAGSKSKKKSPASKTKRLPSPKTTTNSLTKRTPGVPTVDDAVPPITEVQYENVEALMNEFCKVPFLAEFSRPVSLLHPELLTLYSKIVHHPMDLGHIMRAIRRREYKSTRAIQLDMWRVFSNCVKFHTHPSNRDNAIPSFISIANHLRDFFNNLWQEFMMLSDAPPRKPGKGISHVHSSYQKRAEARKERMLSITSTLMSTKCMRKAADAFKHFISTGGKVDNIDKDSVLGDVEQATGDMATFIQSLRELISILEDRIEKKQEYSIGSFQRDLKKTFTEDVFTTEVLKRMRIGSRLDRLFWKIFVPVHEVNSRGVNQSSIWGNMAAVIWARESKKKPFWPAIVLGMMAPEFQKEDWHEALTLQNEKRLPDKLREELQLGKRRAEQALKKQTNEPMSYFLVEFMGTHEFIWVRESDIVETFNPEVDPNVASAAGNVTKKRRSGHSSINPKLMSDAIEEGKWALEEFEILISDPCGDSSEDDEISEDDEPRYTYDVICLSDDEADQLEAVDKRKANDSDLEEQNELLASNGCLDFSIEGRKKAKAKAAEMKKQKAALLKQEKSKEIKAKKDAASKHASPRNMGVTEEDAKQLAKLLEEDEKRAEARRKKRARDHDKSLKELEKQTKKSKASAPDKRSNPNAILEKKARADAFVKSFLIHKYNAHSDFRGAPFIATNSVDPSGLLGMSLAFRAAAGDIPFSDHNGEEFIRNPWDKIDVISHKESSKRCERLQEQIDLIEKEIQKVNAVKARRVSLCDAADHVRDAAEKKILGAGADVKASKKVFVSAKKKRKSLCMADDVKSNEDDDISGQMPLDNSVGGSAVSSPDQTPSKGDSIMNCESKHDTNIIQTNLEETSSIKKHIETSTVKIPSTTPNAIELSADARVDSTDAKVVGNDLEQSKSDCVPSITVNGNGEQKKQQFSSAVSTMKIDGSE